MILLLKISEWWQNKIKNAGSRNYLLFCSQLKLGMCNGGGSRSCLEAGLLLLVLRELTKYIYEKC
jgi:hypothetical protein